MSFCLLIKIFGAFSRRTASLFRAAPSFGAGEVFCFFFAFLVFISPGMHVWAQTYTITEEDSGDYQIDLDQAPYAVFSSGDTLVIQEKAFVDLYAGIPGAASTIISNGSQAWRVINFGKLSVNGNIAHAVVQTSTAMTLQNLGEISTDKTSSSSAVAIFNANDSGAPSITNGGVKNGVTGEMYKAIIKGQETAILLKGGKISNAKDALISTYKPSTLGVIVFDGKKGGGSVQNSGTIDACGGDTSCTKDDVVAIQMPDFDLNNKGDSPVNESVTLATGSVVIGKIVGGAGTGTSEALSLSGSGTLDIQVLNFNSLSVEGSAASNNPSVTWIYTGKLLQTGNISIASGIFQVGDGRGNGFVEQIKSSFDIMLSISKNALLTGGIDQSISAPTLGSIENHTDLQADITNQIGGRLGAGHHGIDLFSDPSSIATFSIQGSYSSNRPAKDENGILIKPELIIKFAESQNDSLVGDRIHFQGGGYADFENTTLVPQYIPILGSGLIKAGSFTFLDTDHLTALNGAKKLDVEDNLAFWNISASITDGADGVGIMTVAPKSTQNIYVIDGLTNNQRRIANMLSEVYKGVSSSLHKYDQNTKTSLGYGASDILNAILASKSDNAAHVLDDMGGQIYGQSDAQIRRNSLRFFESLYQYLNRGSFCYIQGVCGFSQFTLGVGSYQGNRDTVGYSTNTYDLSFGADQRFGNTFTMGVALGYSQNTLEANNLPQNAGFQTYSASFYSTWRPTRSPSGLDSGLFINAAFLYQYISGSASRQLTLPQWSELSTKGHFSGHVAAGSIEGGYRFNLAQDVDVKPYARFDAGWVHRGAVKEDVSQTSIVSHTNVGLNVEAETQTILRLIMGASLKKDFLPQRLEGPISFSLGAGYMRDFSLSHSSVTQSLFDNANSFESKTLGLERNSLFFDLGTSVSLNNNISILVNGQGMFWKESSEVHLSVGVNFAW